jgi:ParB family transcriptional regulator, chromosome partitioning protein
MSKLEIKNIPIECLKSGKYQTRRVFDREALQELAGSIKSEGLIQPIIVRPTNDNEYEIVAGERRWRAAQLIGVDMIPCLVSFYTDEQVAAITPIENIQRENLNPIEEALAYRQLTDEFEYTHEEVAIAVSKSRTKITNLLRLLRLDIRIQELLVSGALSEAHGKMIAGLPSNLQYEVAKKSVDQGWSTRRTDQEVKRLQIVNSSCLVVPGRVSNDPDVRVLEKLMSDQLGSEVKLEADSNQKGGGWLKIRYFNNEILTGILDKLGMNYKE